jgi:hypothetical protein
VSTRPLGVEAGLIDRHDQRPIDLKPVQAWRERVEVAAAPQLLSGSARTPGLDVAVGVPPSVPTLTITVLPTPSPSK